MILVALLAVVAVLAIGAMGLLARGRWQRSVSTERKDLAELSRDLLAGATEQVVLLAAQKLETERSVVDGRLAEQRQAIETSLAPLKEALANVEAQNREMERRRTSAYDGLAEQIQRLAREASSLSTALRRPQVRGQWGELTLRRTAEAAGLTEGVDYVLQESVDTAEGRLRPDMVLRLPHGRTLVVDSKAPMEAFLAAVDEEDEGRKEGHLAQHAQQLRRHVQLLAGKQYWSQFGDAPDFVVLFLPSEALFQAAVERDPALVDASMRSRVILANPMTLIGLMKTVAFAAQQRRLEENCLEVQAVGRHLYDALRVHAEHVGKVGRALTSAVGAYNASVGSLERTVLVKARRMRELGGASGDEIAAVEPTDVLARSLQSRELAEGARALS